MRACHCTLPYSNPNACEGCLKTTVPEKKEEPKMKNAMEDEMFNECADKIVELLLDSGKTFTPHLVTQILRKTEAKVEHQKVREYFDNADEQGWTDFDYAVGYAYVNNSPTRSRVYYLEESDLDFKDSIVMDIKDFEDEIKTFLSWFKDEYEYEYEEGTDTKAPDWNIKIGDNPTYVLPNDPNKFYYVTGNPSTISISGTITKDGFVSSGSTVDASNLPNGTTRWNTGWDNHKNQKRGPDGKWIKQ